VDDAVAVRVAGRLEHLADQRYRLLRRQALVDQRLQRAALEQLHRDVVGAFDVAAVVDGDDVGMREAGGGLGLAAEALDELAVLGEPPVEDLQRDATLQVRVLGEPDVSHPARTDPLQQPVATVDRASLADFRRHRRLPS